jgi:hypothetical protein
VKASVSTPLAPDGLAFDGELLWVATANGPELAGIGVASETAVVAAQVADEGFINANQVMAFEADSLWLPILGRGVVLQVTPPA